MATISYKRCLYGFIGNMRHASIDHYQKPGRQRETPSGPSTALEVIHEVCEVGDAACHDDTIDLRAKLASNLRPRIERPVQDYQKAITLVEFKPLH